MRIWILAPLLLALTECSDSGSGCVTGEVIGSSCCTGTSFVSLHAPFPGKPATFNSKTYENGIQILGTFQPGTVYLKLRPFNEQRDTIGAICYCLVAESWADTPLFVAESVSTEACTEVN
jgi:hypothetical protein